MLRTGRLLHPASPPASRPTTEVSLPGTLASPRTGLTPAGCRELLIRLRQTNLPYSHGVRTAGHTWIQGLIEEHKMWQEAKAKARLAAKPPTGFQGGSGRVP